MPELLKGRHIPAVACVFPKLPGSDSRIMIPYARTGCFRRGISLVRLVSRHFNSGQGWSYVIFLRSIVGKSVIRRPAFIIHTPEIANHYVPIWDALEDAEFDILS